MLVLLPSPTSLESPGEHILLDETSLQTDGKGILEIVTPLVTHDWEDALAKHPDKEFCHYIILGIRQGFLMWRAMEAERNMQFAMVNPGPVEKNMEEEAGNERITDLNLSEYRRILVNWFGVIPKWGQVKRWRLILDLLSYPTEVGSARSCPSCTMSQWIQQYNEC